GHHAEHISRVVDDSGDGVHRAVRAPPLVGVTGAANVAKDHLAFALKSIERLVVRGVTSVTVRDWNAKDRAVFIAVAEQRLGRLDAQLNELGNELEAGVSQQRSAEQPGLARDLESVADRQHRTAAIGMCDHVSHHGAEPGDGAGTQIVAVAEAARQHDHVAALKIVILVPQIDRVLAERFGHGVKRVVVAVGARKGDDAELHAAMASTPAISKSSVTGLASRRSHTSRTAPKPSVCSASATVLPCGSRMPRRDVM